MIFEFQPFDETRVIAAHRVLVVLAIDAGGRQSLK